MIRQRFHAFIDQLGFEAVERFARLGEHQHLGRWLLGPDVLEQMGESAVLRITFGQREPLLGEPGVGAGGSRKRRG